MPASLRAMASLLRRYVTRKKASMGRALVDTCGDLGDLPPNQDLPLMRAAPLRLSGIYPYPMRRESLLAPNPQVSISRREQWTINAYEYANLLFAFLIPSILWIWVLCSGMDLSSFILNSLEVCCIVNCLFNPLGRPDLTQWLGDWLTHMRPEAHALCIAHPASGCSIVATAYAALVALGMRREFIYRLHRYLFTRDPDLLILPTTPQTQVKVWRVLYVTYALGVLASCFFAFLIWCSIM